MEGTRKITILNSHCVFLWYTVNVGNSLWEPSGSHRKSSRYPCVQPRLAGTTGVESIGKAERPVCATRFVFDRLNAVTPSPKGLVAFSYCWALDLARSGSRVVRP